MILGPVEVPREAVQRTQRHEVQVIRRHQRRACRPGGEVGEEFLLALLGSVDSAESFEVGEADIGDHAMRRIGDAGQQGDFTLVVGPHLHEGEFHVGRHGEEGEGTPMWLFRLPSVACTSNDFDRTARRSSLVVVFPLLGQAEDRARKLRVPVPVGQVLQGGQDIFHVEAAASTERRVVHHGGEAAGGEGLAAKALPSKRSPFRAKKSLPGPHRRVSVVTPSDRSNQSSSASVDVKFMPAQEKANPVRLEANTGFAMNRGSVVGISCLPWRCPRRSSTRHGATLTDGGAAPDPPRGSGGFPG